MLIKSRWWSISAIVVAFLMLFYFTQATWISLAFPKLPTDENGWWHLTLMSKGENDLGPEGDNDAIFIVSVNNEKGVAMIFNIGRDFVVDGKRMRSLSENEVMENLGEEFGLSFVGSVGIEKEAFVLFVDGMGGIPVSVGRDLDDPMYPSEDGGWQEVFIPKGEHIMGGELAYMYARSRKSTSEEDRLGRQLQIAEGVKNKALEHRNNYWFWLKILRELDPYINRSMSWRSLVRSSYSALGIQKGCLLSRMVYPGYIEDAFEELKDSLPSGPSFKFSDDFSTKDYMQETLNSAEECKRG